MTEEVNKFWKNVTDKARCLVPMQVFPAVVKKVDEKLRTCTVRVNDNVDIEDVRLYAVVDDGLKGFCLLPATDSIVLVGRIANSNELFVCSFSVVDKVVGTIGDKVEIAIDEESLSYKCDKTKATIKSNDIQINTENVSFTVSKNQVTVKAQKVVFNDGENGGLININDLSGYIDEIVSKFNNHTHTFPIGAIGVEGSPAKQANTAVIISPTPDSTVKAKAASSYEDSTIEH